jgi:cytochrome o ubiquinol oxidase subunit 3
MSKPIEATIATPVDMDQEADNKTIFGFWVYLMTDCVLFAALFATYAVLHLNTFGGVSSQDIFSPPFVLIETLLLLTSSFTCGLSLLASRKNSVQRTLIWLGITFLLGVAFLTMELSEFHHLIEEGNSWRQSGFLSSFFTLVATHGLHISVGLLWLLTLAYQTVRRGFTEGVKRRLTLFSMFWHFLDVVWIFIFTIVYMMGVVPK